jgi:inorganic pyrophosphatase
MKDLYTQYLEKDVNVIMDRPLGSNHPKHGFRYEVNYGFIPDTKASDGEEVDAYVLGVDTPLEKFSGKCIAVIHRLNDDDDKLVVVAESSKEMTDDEIIMLTLFQEKYFKSIIIRGGKGR